VVEGFLIRGTGRPVIATFDTRDDRLRRRTLPAGPYGGRPEIPTLAPRSDGAIALLERDATDRIVYLAPRGAGFEAPVVVATLPRGQVEGHTLRLTRAGVSWRATGQPRSAPDS
jgi:hypothetical protein